MRKILAIILLLSLVFSSVAVSATREVGAGKTYSTIQAAVTAAADEDLIYIFNGTYHETIITALDLDFEGESKAGVIWTGHYVAVGSPSWAKTGGYTYVYEATESEIISSGTVQSIVDEDYRGLYQEVASIAAVDATPGTHYTTGGKVYVRSPDDADPDTHTLWFSIESEVNILSLTAYAGNRTISDMTFIGAPSDGAVNATKPQRAINIIDTAANLGTISITDVDMFVAAFKATSSDTTGGTVNLLNTIIRYNLSPVYDTNFDIWATSYQSGASLSLVDISTATLTSSKIQFSRTGINFKGDVFTGDKSLLTDFTVHPAEMPDPSTDSVYTFKNCIFSMHGSTVYTPASTITSEANDGYEWHFYNNIIYPGGTNKQFFDPSENVANTDYISDVKVYWYNNLSVHDHYTLIFNKALDGTNIFSDDNYFAVGSSSDVSDIIYRIPTPQVKYTLAEWQSFTSGAGWARDVNSTYALNLSTVKLVVEDGTDTLNPDFGKVESTSPVVDYPANATYAPVDDYAGTSRPQGASDDIGAYEYVGAVSTSNGGVILGSGNGGVILGSGNGGIY